MKIDLEKIIEELDESKRARKIMKEKNVDFSVVTYLDGMIRVYEKIVKGEYE